MAVPIGTVIDYAGSSVPDGWLECDGSAVSRTTYAALFAVLGTTWGSGNGSTTFNLPNLGGRVAIGKGSRNVGATGGAETHTLTVNEMPSHTHGLNNHTHNIPALSGTASSTNSAHVHTTNVEAYSDYPPQPNYSASIDARYKTCTRREDKNGYDTKSGTGAHSHSVTTVANTTGGNSGDTTSRGGAHLTASCSRTQSSESSSARRDSKVGGVDDVHPIEQRQFDSRYRDRQSGLVYLPRAAAFVRETGLHPERHEIRLAMGIGFTAPRVVSVQFRRNLHAGMERECDLATRTGVAA